uniref:Uncharacterized protein n=1 Tax=Micrurus lemniscatus lemniscatus TaxID=129467 RepID=A0A2D4JCW2_MICLE
MLPALIFIPGLSTLSHHCYCHGGPSSGHQPLALTPYIQWSGSSGPVASIAVWPQPSQLWLLSAACLSPLLPSSISDTGLHVPAANYSSSLSLLWQWIQLSSSSLVTGSSSLPLSRQMPLPLSPKKPNLIGIQAGDWEDFNEQSKGKEVPLDDSNLLTGRAPEDSIGCPLPFIFLFAI